MKRNLLMLLKIYTKGFTLCKRATKINKIKSEKKEKRGEIMAEEKSQNKQ